MKGHVALTPTMRKGVISFRLRCLHSCIISSASSYIYCRRFSLRAQLLYTKKDAAPHTLPHTRVSKRPYPFTYRFHRRCHIIISLSLLSQPGFLHQLLAVDHVGVLCGFLVGVFDLRRSSCRWVRFLEGRWKWSVVSIAMQWNPRRAKRCSCSLLSVSCYAQTGHPSSPPSLTLLPPSSHTLTRLRHLSERRVSVPVM